MFIGAILILSCVVASLCLHTADPTKPGSQKALGDDQIRHREIQEYFPLPDGYQTQSGIDEKKPAVAAGGKIVKIRQGPFKIIAGEQISSEDQWIPQPELPCKDCYITAIQGDLEYEDGTPAALDKGAMLQVGRCPWSWIG
jgi:hypothetical protein